MNTDNKNIETEQCTIPSVIPRFSSGDSFILTPTKLKGYTVRKAETKEDAITDFNRIFPELKHYRIDFLNEA